MIRILLADDSQTETALLKALFESEKDMEVIATAKNGKEAVALSEKLHPDIITMDIYMPEMSGIEATHLIMTRHPVPIIIISSYLNSESMHASFLALEAGAVSVLPKPTNFLSPNDVQEKNKVLEMIRVMAGIKVIKRRFPTYNNNKIFSISASDKTKRHFEIIGIGASVGGPQALKCILSQLPIDFPLPMVIVQHITPGFISGFAKWLNENTLLTVKEAQDLELLKPSTIYFAPDKHHLTISRSQNGLIAKLVKAPPVSGFCPSITVLFNSIAKCCGKNAVGMLLTGMGQDGAQGLLEMKQAHAHTLIQDQESAVVFGMAGVAQSLNAVDKVVELDNIANYLQFLVTRPLT